MPPAHERGEVLGELPELVELNEARLVLVIPVQQRLRLVGVEVCAELLERLAQLNRRDRAGAVAVELRKDLEVVDERRSNDSRISI